MIKDFDVIRESIRQKYMLDSNNIAVGSQVWFIFMDEQRTLEKAIKKGRINKVDGKTYTIMSDSQYGVPRILTFMNRHKAEEILKKISVDELRFLY